MARANVVQCSLLLLLFLSLMPLCSSISEKLAAASATVLSTVFEHCILFALFFSFTFHYHRLLLLLPHSSFQQLYWQLVRIKLLVATTAIIVVVVVAVVILLAKRHKHEDEDYDDDDDENEYNN